MYRTQEKKLILSFLLIFAITAIISKIYNGLTILLYFIVYIALVRFIFMSIIEVKKKNKLIFKYLQYNNFLFLFLFYF
jgi:4-hydroxybenzoate polyprenyltransferase